jgi:hypothetical protein
MRFKYFIDKEKNVSIAINPDEVYLVEDSPLGTRILFTNNSYVVVTENYMMAVTRLSEF